MFTLLRALGFHALSAGGGIAALMGSGWVKWIVLVALAVGPAAWTYHTLSVDHAAELQKIRIEERAHCQRQMLDIERKINEDVARKIAKAKEAAEAIEDPQTPQELIEICTRSAYCRNKGDF